MRFADLARLPASIDDPGLFDRLSVAVTQSGRKIIALDDDPTGSQTVHDTPVLTAWNVEAFAAELRDPHPLLFVLTNSRSLPACEAAAINRDVANQVITASQQTGRPVAFLSRSDSTLRGHYEAETTALAGALGDVDGVLVCPAFFEGGRYTVDDVHYLREGDALTPVNETEFAGDATFGFRHANLRQWIEEKTGGRLKAAEVASISIAEIREGGPDTIEARLMSVTGGQPVIVNCAGNADLAIVCLGLLRAEAAGKRFIYRTGAGFARVRAGIPNRPLLTRADLLGAGAPAWVPGLVVVGSHVQKSSDQLARLLTSPRMTGVELNVPALLIDAQRSAAISVAIEQIDQALARGDTATVFTSRRVVTGSSDDQLAVSRSVSAAMVEVVRGISNDPGFVIGKGGITSSDIGTQALEARRPVVIGQVRPGVPVWRLGAESRAPGRAYIVFPGNVGTPETLAELVAELREPAGGAITRANA